MKFSLGIDAGGTYTDAVILRDSDGEVVDSMKARTTYPDLLIGIQNALDGLDGSYLEDVSLVSVSTTLATNTILEKTGYPVGLILVGNAEMPNNSSIRYSISVSGGHSTGGNEVEPLDIEAVEEFILAFKDKVSAFAVSSFFSIRNPKHELEVKRLVEELTGLPVVCGHELSQSLGAYDRGVTAFLNAQLIPIANQFTKTVVSEIKRRGIDAKMMMLKCDGSIVGMHEALKHPIESIFTGPAASLLGASYLARNKNCAVIDVGGTSTDVAMVINGLPQLSQSGAVVGGWQTKVEAIRMETAAMGGDSHVWVRNHVIYTGPRRVIPLCVAASKYPKVIEKLRSGQHILGTQLSENLQPTKMFIKTGQEPIQLTVHEKELLDRIGVEPITISEIYWEDRKFPSPMALDSLIQKRLIQAIGFTPTDALHVLGDYAEWNKEASVLGATLLGKFMDMDKLDVCTQVKKDVTMSMAQNLLSYLFKGVEPAEIRKVLDGSFYGGFNVDIPVVLLGGPVSAYVNDLGELIDAEIILPDHAKVGNAVGALAGKGVKRIEILIRSSFGESKYNLRPTSISVFYPGGKEDVSSHAEALDYSKELGNRLILEYMHDAELDGGDIRIDVSRKDITINEGGIPIETRLIFLGTVDIRKVQAQ
ncbi:MAG: hydantoinase/oxoprolinase N-terminal domain-containing protein [Methanosarcinaceae archaeon]